MTWPFENDTSAVVKRISNRSISANRKRNLFTIITIALAAALLLAIMLYGFGTSQANINRTKDTAQIVFTNITQEQGDKLYEQNQIDWIGEFTLVSTEQVNNSTFYLQYGNAEMFDAQGMTYSGNIPVSANEIMLQKSFLKEKRPIRLHIIRATASRYGQKQAGRKMAVFSDRGKRATDKRAGSAGTEARPHSTRSTPGLRKKQTHGGGEAEHPDSRTFCRKNEAPPNTPSQAPTRQNEKKQKKKRSRNNAFSEIFIIFTRSKRRFRRKSHCISLIINL